jgi:hypothetical protein
VVRFVAVAFVLALVTGCRAPARIENVRTDVPALSRAEPFLVAPVTANEAKFSGDGAGNQQKIADEKKTIHETMAPRLVSKLAENGFAQAAVLNGPSAAPDALVLEMALIRYNHGEGALRGNVGLGAGRSSVHFTCRLWKGAARDKPVGDFDVSADSGNQGGWTNMGSFLDEHLRDATDALAEYLASKAR